ncbi:hypothetical protein HDV00_009450, partial [Rhizophlyctis rosea]
TACNLSTHAQAGDSAIALFGPHNTPAVTTTNPTNAKLAKKKKKVLTFPGFLPLLFRSISERVYPKTVTSHASWTVEEDDDTGLEKAPTWFVIVGDIFVFEFEEGVVDCDQGEEDGKDMVGVFGAFGGHLELVCCCLRGSGLYVMEV